MAVEAVVFDVGETLVDETNMWVRAAEAAGVTPFTLMAGLGATIALERQHDEAWELLGIDRSAELEATRAAAAVGVGPEVVEFVGPEGWLVTRFVEGAIPRIVRMYLLSRASSPSLRRKWPM